MLPRHDKAAPGLTSFHRGDRPCDQKPEKGRSENAEQPTDQRKHPHHSVLLVHIT